MKPTHEKRLREIERMLPPLEPSDNIAVVLPESVAKYLFHMAGLAVKAKGIMALIASPDSRADVEYVIGGVNRWLEDYEK